MSKRNAERLARKAEERRLDGAMQKAQPTRRDRRALARDIVKHSPGLIEKIMDEEEVTRGRARQLAVRYISHGLKAQQIIPETGRTVFESDEFGTVDTTEMDE